MIPRILTIAGSDSGGGAGIQADVKTAMALGVHASTAITALTVQDTHGVHAIHAIPPDFVRQQIKVALADPGADAVKSGMLGDTATIEAVAGVLEANPLPLVVDPVMVAKGGAALLAPSALASLRRVLLPLAALITPNIPEAELLAGCDIADLAAMHRAAEALLSLGAPAILLKGGHMAGDTVTDLLVTAAGTTAFTRPRLHTRHTHGTGCTLATAIACGLASGHDLLASVERARSYVQAAIAASPGIGAGHGPLGHMVLPNRPDLM